MVRACAALLALLAWGCGDPAPRSSAPPAPAARHAETGRVFALLVNGGGKPESNYRSHLLHVRELADLLTANGVPREHIVALVSDGSDPAADLALREPEPGPDFWLIEELGIGRALRGELRYEDSRLDGLRVVPATEEALSVWAGADGRALGAGDTLLFYVTDHGQRGATPEQGTIVLWGEALSVAELRDWLGRLAPGVRVVLLMSQCFSGAFAHALLDGDAGGAIGGCGFFSSTAERPAYGCYPENRDVDNVGHSFRFAEALRAGLAFADAHAHVSLSDHTPDVPLRTSDLYLARALDLAAEQRGAPREAVVEELLAASLAQPEAVAAEIDLLGRMAREFGTPAPRTLAELEASVAEIRSLRETLDAHAGRWREVLRDLADTNLDRFLRERPDWRARLVGQALERLDFDERRRLAAELLEDLADHARADDERWERLVSLRAIAKAAREAAYRMEVRLAALLRMRVVLERIAGLEWVARSADAGAQQELERLEACERFALAPGPALSAAELPLPAAFPSLAAELDTLDLVLPGWIGVEYAPLEPAERVRLGLSVGAVRVARVEPGSPAARAGLLAGDVLLGPPGEPFDEPHRVREWIMTSLEHERRELEILRDGVRSTLEIETGAAPDGRAR